MNDKAKPPESPDRADYGKVEQAAHAGAKDRPSVDGPRKPDKAADRSKGEKGAHAGAKDRASIDGPRIPHKVPDRGKADTAPITIEDARPHDRLAAAREAGVNVATYEEIEKRVNGAAQAPHTKRADGRKDFNSNPDNAKAQLDNLHFRDDRERLSYGFGFFEGVAAAIGISPEALSQEAARMLFGHEVNYSRKNGALVVHERPTQSEVQELERARAHEQPHNEVRSADPNNPIRVGPIDISQPEPDGAGRLLMTISGSVADKDEAMKVIAGRLAVELKEKENSKASVEAIQLPDSTGRIQPTIRVSNVGGYELWLGLQAVQYSYFSDLDNNTVSQEGYDNMQAGKAWAGVFGKLGNIINNIPLTEFTDQGFEFTGVNSPQDMMAFVKGVKDIRRLKGQGQISRRTLGELADKAADVKKVTALMRNGLDSNAWRKSLDQLSGAERAVLKQLSQAHDEVLRAIKAGQKEKAYGLVERWREPARTIYNKLRDAYWKDPRVRKEWGEAGADMSKNAPTLRIEEIQNGKKVYVSQTVTLEHKIRLHDNPFLAVSEKNLVNSFSYENTVILEDIRRIERGGNTVWTVDPVELFVRTLELNKK